MNDIVSLGGFLRECHILDQKKSTTQSLNITELKVCILEPSFHVHGISDQVSHLWMLSDRTLTWAVSRTSSGSSCPYSAHIATTQISNPSHGPPWKLLLWIQLSQRVSDCPQLEISGGYVHMSMLLVKVNKKSNKKCNQKSMMSRHSHMIWSIDITLPNH